MMVMSNLLVLFVVVLSFHGSFAADTCYAGSGKRCLTKDEVGGLSMYMVAGDPCFVYSNKRYCFVDKATGMMNSCTCTAECGCENEEDVEPPPSCDNSEVPPTGDCSADQARFCPLGTDNTMCRYCGVDLTACQNAVCSIGLTDDEKETIVQKHNELRSRIALGQETVGYFTQGGSAQPPAANMVELVWDDELADVAQRWCNQCPSGHDTNRNTPEFAYVGQNKASSYSTANVADKGLETKVQAWYDEVQYWPPSLVSSFTSSGTTGTVGHFSQVVWAVTTKIGCGYVQYKDSRSSYPYTKILICNYGSGGNYNGQPVYEVGSPGSSCPGAVTSGGLCKQ